MLKPHLGIRPGGDAPDTTPIESIQTSLKDG